MRQSAVLKEFAKLTDNQKDTIRKTIEVMVRVNILEKICVALDCKFDDIVDIVPTRK